MLGSTFGGNHLACTAALAVLEVIEKEQLVENAQRIGQYALSSISETINVKELRGRGLMIGIEMPYPVKTLREKMLFEHRIFTGNAGTDTIRLLPPLCVGQKEIDCFLDTLKKLTL